MNNDNDDDDDDDDDDDNNNNNNNKKTSVLPKIFERDEFDHRIDWSEWKRPNAWNVWWPISRNTTQFVPLLVYT